MIEMIEMIVMIEMIWAPLAGNVLHKGAGMVRRGAKWRCLGFGCLRLRCRVWDLPMVWEDF